MNKIYEPILAKVNEWIADQNQNEIPADVKPYPDTVISLWNMLQLVLVRLNDEKAMRELGEGYYENLTYFPCKTLRVLDHLRADIGRYLPEAQAEVEQLSVLFRLGATRANGVMLPDRTLYILKKQPPINDDMGLFLEACSPGGMYAEHFEGTGVLKRWAAKEKLQDFYLTYGFLDGLRLPEYMRSPEAKVEHVQEVLKRALDMLRRRRNKLLGELMENLVDNPMEQELSELLQTRIVGNPDRLPFELPELYVCHDPKSRRSGADQEAGFFQMDRLERYETTERHYFDPEFEPIDVPVTGVSIVLTDVDNEKYGRYAKLPDGRINFEQGGTLQEILEYEGITLIPLEIAESYGLRY